MKNTISKNNDSRAAYNTVNILASDVLVNQDTRISGINNNVLVIGPSGSGKTRNYVKPNIMQANTSMIVSDAKGSLYGEFADYLRANGYTVYLLDFVNMKSNIGYNPLDYIRFDDDGFPKEQDVVKISEIVIESFTKSDPFWDVAARMYLQSGIAYVTETFPDEEKTLYHVAKLMEKDGGKAFKSLMFQYKELYPDSLASRRFDAFLSIGAADKMMGSILGIVCTNLSSFELRELQKINNMPERIDFSRFGRQKTALFLSVSDTDRSMDRPANLFWTQALQSLCLSADTEYLNHCLDVPVRLYLDDFATNVYIPDFDKISSNIRSREIYCSVILQSLSQLEALYGSAKADTIIGNCDQQLVLGVQDVKTASHFSQRGDVPASLMLNMPLDRCIVFLRGQKAKYTTKFDVGGLSSYAASIDAKTAEPPVPETNVQSEQSCRIYQENNIA